MIPKAFSVCSLTCGCWEKERYSDNPERLCSRIDPGQSHYLLMPYKTSPAILSQHRMPRSFELSENMLTFLRF